MRSDRDRHAGPIPADAGEPRRASSRAGWTGAYPRGRGGALGEDGRFVFAEGLSPRTRGSQRPTGRG